MTEVVCPLGIAPEDVAAWSVDGEPHADVDLAAHVPRCAACSSAAASVAPAAGVGDALRAATAAAPPAVTARAADRIRLEATAGLLVKTFLGAADRVARAAADYLLPPRERNPP